MIREAVLCVLMSLPPHYTDAEEPAAEREKRLEEIAGAVTYAVEHVSTGDAVQLAAAVLVLGWAESRWARYVGEGRCEDGPKGARCDPDRRGVPRARSYWQLHRRACRQLWATPKGSRAALQAAAVCAARRWQGGLKMCAGRCKWGPQAGAFAAYRGGVGPDPCNWPGALARKNLLSVYLSRMRSGRSALRINAAASHRLARRPRRAFPTRRSGRWEQHQSSRPERRASRQYGRPTVSAPKQSCADARRSAPACGAVRLFWRYGSVAWAIRPGVSA
jgi:hypothetical protein